MHQLRKLKRLSAFLAVGLIATAAFAPASQAREPAPGYSQFSGCPSPEEDSLVVQCVISTITSGHFQMGNKDTPITQPIVLNGGIHRDGVFAFSPSGGLSKSKQVVPGGIVGITGLDELGQLLGTDALTVYAVTELAGQVEVHSGILNLPIKVHLINPVIGNNCYVGSAAEPIALHLIVGTTDPPPPNEPITGKGTENTFDATTKISHQKNGTYVDNSFAAPAAKGCVLNLGIIPLNISALVNLQSGLPSPAGTNETVQNFEAESTLKSVVYPAL